MVETASGQMIVQTVMPDHSFSLMSLFWGADIVVQLVILGLLMASFFSWTIIFTKVGTIKRVRIRSNRMEKEFWRARSFADFDHRASENDKDPVARMFLLSQEELFRFRETYTVPTSQDLDFLGRRLQHILSAYLDAFLGRLSSHVSFLATVGSAAPFIGLFGTVWGIMHSFQAIAGAKNTSLAVVAPGIAEALFATAIGLVAAIPAVIAYNKIVASIQSYTQQLETFMSELISLIQQNASAR